MKPQEAVENIALTLASLFERVDIATSHNADAFKIVFTDIDSMSMLDFLLSIETAYSIKLDLDEFLGAEKLETLGDLAVHIESVLKATRP